MTGAVVVGASSAIGSSICRELREQHYLVVGVSAEPWDDNDLPVHLVGDCSIPTVATDVVAQAVDLVGELGVVVLAAAKAPVAPAAQTSDDQWRQALGATLDSAFFVARAALPHMPRGSSIVAVTSVNASLAAPGLPGYAAAKAGVEGLVRQLALEYGPHDIRVNAVAPAMITSSDLPHSTDGYPLGRVGRPEDVASAAAFLAGDQASFITGTVLTVDGGLSISSPAAWLRPDLRSRWLTNETPPDSQLPHM